MSRPEALHHLLERAKKKKYFSCFKYVSHLCGSWYAEDTVLEFIEVLSLLPLPFDKMTMSACQWSDIWIAKTRISVDCVGPEDASLSVSTGTEVDVMSSFNLFLHVF